MPRPTKFRPKRDYSTQAARAKALTRLENLWKQDNEDGEWEPSPCCSPAISDPNRERVAASLKDIPLIADGAAPAAEVSRRLAAVDIFVSAFDDGVSTRRGSLMAGLQHGLPIAGTVGRFTDHVLKSANGAAFLLAPALSVDAFHEIAAAMVADDELRSTLGKRARALFDEQFSWTRIAERMRAALITDIHQPIQAGKPSKVGRSCPW